MVIVSNIYEVTLRSYSLFYKNVNTVSSRIFPYKVPRIHPHIKAYVISDSRLLWLFNNT